MTEISRVNLFGKLNEACYQSIESATVFCKLRTNPYVEIVHWLHQILATQDSDLQHLVRHFELDAARLAKDLTSALDRLPRGASSISDLSTQVEESVERAWVYASLLFGDSRVRTGHLLVGWLKTPTLRNTLLGISREFDKVKADALSDGFAKLVERSAKTGVQAAIQEIMKADKGPAWIAYSAPVIPGEHHMCCYRWERMTGNSTCCGSCRLDSRSHDVSFVDRVGDFKATLASVFFVFMRFENKSIGQVRAFSTDCRPPIWKCVVTTSPRNHFPKRPLI